MARLFVGSNFKASLLPVPFYEYLKGLPDSFSVCLEFVSPGARQRQIDCAILGPHGVDVIELKRHTGVVTASPDAPWRQEKDGRITTISNRKSGIEENPFQQAKNSSDDFITWIRRQLGREIAHRPTVLMCPGNPLSTFRDDNFAKWANGIDDLPKQLINSRNHSSVPFHSGEHAKVIAALRLAELGITTFYGVVQDGHTQQRLSGIQIVVESLTEPLLTNGHGEFSFVNLQGASLSLQILSSGGYHEHTVVETLNQNEQWQYYLLQPLSDAKLEKDVLTIREQIEALFREQAGQSAANALMRAEMQRLRAEHEADLEALSATRAAREPAAVEELQAQLDAVQAHIAALDAPLDEHATVLAALDFVENNPRTFRSGQSHHLSDGFGDYTAGLRAMAHNELAMTVATLKHVTIQNLSADGIESLTTSTGQLLGRARNIPAIKSLGTKLPKLRFDHATEFLEPHITALREASNKRGISHLAVTNLQVRISNEVEQLRDVPRATLEREVTRQLCGRLRVRISADEEHQYRLLLNEVAKGLDIKERYYTTPQLTERIYSTAMTQIEEQTRKHLESMSADEEQALIADLDNKLQEMTADQQRAIMRDLGLDRVTGKILLQSFVGGGVMLGAATVATSTGFGLYLAATTILHAVATTMFGVTLGFGVYTGLTSTIAFFLNPVVTSALIFASFGGVMLTQGKRLPRKVAAMVLGQILSRRLHEKSLQTSSDVRRTHSARI